MQLVFIVHLVAKFIRLAKFVYPVTKFSIGLIESVFVITQGLDR